VATQQKSSSTDTDVKVAAREQLDQVENPRDTADTLRNAADAQEKAQSEQLKAGQGGEQKDGPTLAHNRVAVSHQSVGVQGGRIDQMTRRDVTDALENHFCTVDRTHKGVNSDDLPDGQDGYGVYIEPATTDEHGYPTTARVRLHGESIFRVFPYDALRPAESRGR
jgi:hypothetical protein